MFRPEAIRLENLGVGFEADPSTIAFGCGFNLGVVCQFTEFEAGAFHLAFSNAFHHELCAQRVHSLGSHAVQTHRLLEGAAVVLAAGVDFRNAVDHLPQRNAAAVVADTHLVVFDDHLDRAAVAHGVFVDAVVNDFLQQDVDAVVGVFAVSELADVHPRAHPDVLLPIKAPDVVFCVRDLF